MVEVSYARFKISIPEIGCDHLIHIKDVCEHPDDAAWDETTKTLSLPASSFHQREEGRVDLVEINILDRVRVEVTSDLSKSPVLIVKLLSKL